MADTEEMRKLLPGSRLVEEPALPGMNHRKNPGQNIPAAAGASPTAANDITQSREFRYKQALDAAVESTTQTLPREEVATSGADDERVSKPQAPAGSVELDQAGKPTPAGALVLPAVAPIQRGGRPTLMTADLEEKVCMLLSLGMSRRQAAVYLDIDHLVIARAMERDAEFARNVQRSEELAMVQPLLAVIGEARKNWRVATWLLEHKSKHRPRLTEAEKAERHQERLLDARRKIELERDKRIMTRLANIDEDAYFEARAEARRQAEEEQRHPRRKKQQPATGG